MSCFPAAHFAQHVLPVVCQEQDSARKIILTKPATAQQCPQSLLSPQEVQGGTQLLREAQPISPGFPEGAPMARTEKKAGMHRCSQGLPASRCPAHDPLVADTAPTQPAAAQNTAPGRQGQTLQAPPFRPGITWHQWLRKCARPASVARPWGNT